MSYIAPLARIHAPSLEDVFDAHEKRSGFVPNGFLILARNPDFLTAYHKFTSYALTGGTLPASLKYLCAMVASDVAGCVYCQTHLAIGLRKNGVPLAKVQDAIRAREAAMSLDAIERHGVALAHAGASQPGRTHSGQLQALVDAIGLEGTVELAALIAQFGFLYRYNGMAGSRIEQPALDYAREALQPAGWAPGIHDPAAELEKTGRGEGLDILAQRVSASPDMDAAARWAIIGRAPEQEETAFVGALGHSPRIKRLYLGIVETIRQTSTIDPRLALLAEGMASLAAGSRYDQAHVLFEATRAGVPAGHMAQLRSFETSSLYSQAERRALLQKS